jgi:hypothetical protein
VFVCVKYKICAFLIFGRQISIEQMQIVVFRSILFKIRFYYFVLRLNFWLFD